uniref:Uncharacterized protein n=1 Tax=Mus musculus TaxID=10090 RepID=Q3TZV8_MOUSE|nr:unnamed protein product [Mus musculus]
MMLLYITYYYSIYQIHNILYIMILLDCDINYGFSFLISFCSFLNFLFIFEGKSYELWNSPFLDFFPFSWFLKGTSCHCLIKVLCIAV